MGRLAIWTYSHFAVDFGCFYVLFAGLKAHVGSNPETLAAGFLAYNVIAFGLQSLIGLACDERPALRRVCGFAGCILVCTAVVMAAVFGGYVSWEAMVIGAFGNACFHVGGGIDVLTRSGGKMSPAGIFVSSGAMGVALGTLCRSGLTAVLIVAAAVALTWILARADAKECAEKYDYVNFRVARNGGFLLLTGLLMAAVFVRSYAGSIMPLDWERTGWLVIGPAAASCIGKALGGMAGDWLGAGRTGVVSLLISVPLICLGSENVVLSLAGILLFNMTMPITLCGLVSLMPENPGFAFGLTTLALLVGVGITYFWAMPAELVKPVVAVLTISGAACIRLSVNNRKEERR